MELIKNLKVVRGQAKTIVHADYKKLHDALFDFTEGGFLSIYFNHVVSKNSGQKLPLPNPTILLTEDPTCIIVQSYRYSSVSNEVYRMIQRFTSFDRVLPPAADDDEEAKEKQGTDIAFWTIAGEDVPNDEANNKYFVENGLIVVENSYAERGNILLSYKPHSQTALIFNVEVGVDEEHFKLSLIHKLLQSALELTKQANEHYDRSDEVDALVRANFINKVMPSAKPLTPKESSLISTSMEYVSMPFTRIPGSLKKSSSIEMFHILSSE